MRLLYTGRDWSYGTIGTFPGGQVYRRADPSGEKEQNVKKERNREEYGSKMCEILIFGRGTPLTIVGMAVLLVKAPGLSELDLLKFETSNFSFIFLFFLLLSP